MRKNLTRILVLVGSLAVFGLGATTAYAEEATVVGVYEPVEIPVGVLLDLFSQKECSEVAPASSRLQR